MTAHVYNASLAVGLLLIGFGLGLWSVPAALVTVGALVILLTIFATFLARRR